MLNKTHMLVIGGDARTVEVINELGPKLMGITLIGFDKKTFSIPKIHQSSIEEINWGTVDAIILPVSGTSIDGKVKSVYTDQNITITKEMIEKTPKNCVIYTGISNSFLDGIERETNRKIVRIFSRDDIAISNSIPTAEATLAIAIEQTEFTIQNSKVTVLGFGRVGKTVARLFHNVGANVSVSLRNSASAARAREMGLQVMEQKYLKENVSDSDICINTIPHLILDAEILSQMAHSCLIIDIASNPGGTDFEYANKLGIKAIHALGLPGKTAPKTAGKIIANTIEQLMVGRN